MSPPVSPPVGRPVSVSGEGRFGTNGDGQVSFTLTNETVRFDRARGQRFHFEGDVESRVGAESEATLSGTGQWNGTNGYAVDISVADKASWGRLRDTIAVVIRDASGAIVFTSFGPQTLKLGDITVTPDSG